MSNIGTAVGFIVLGGYLMLKSQGSIDESLNWIPLLCFSWTNFISFMGVQSITHTVFSEILPEKIKETGISFCQSLLWGGLFINVKLLPTLTEFIGFSGSVFIYAGISIFGALFTIFYIPETKGKNHEQIMKALE